MFYTMAIVYTEASVLVATTASVQGCEYLKFQQLLGHFFETLICTQCDNEIRRTINSGIIFTPATYSRVLFSFTELLDGNYVQIL